MSLYDGLYDDSGKGKDQELKKDVAGWSSGIKLLQSQLQLKKAALTQNKTKKNVLAPVVNLKSKKDDSEFVPPPPIGFVTRDSGLDSKGMTDPNIKIEDEYDPLWPNDYEKICKAMEEKKQRDREEERNREYEERERRRRDRFERTNRDRDDDRSSMRRRPPPDEEEENRPRRSSNIGAAIAPPPSLMEDIGPSKLTDPSPSFNNTGMGGSVAAKIMAKYGFKEGQGLGKKEQGMSQALQVEKTSKRGGKIIHERDIPKNEMPMMLGKPETEPKSLTEVMKNPSKVVLLQNMVGPGEVDEDLEPETYEECGKYGEVVKCVVFEIPGMQVPEEEAVRIFVEFKRMESAIKAVVDLNGRYFGGRVVKAGFYDPDKFMRLELNA